MTITALRAQAGVWGRPASLVHRPRSVDFHECHGPGGVGAVRPPFCSGAGTRRLRRQVSALFAAFKGAA